MSAKILVAEGDHNLTPKEFNLLVFLASGSLDIDLRTLTKGEGIDAA